MFWYPLSLPLPNLSITHRDNQVCAAAQAFIETFLFDPSTLAGSSFHCEAEFTK